MAKRELHTEFVPTWSAIAIFTLPLQECVPSVYLLDDDNNVYSLLRNTEIDWSINTRPELLFLSREMSKSNHVLISARVLSI